MPKNCLISRLASWTAGNPFEWDNATYDPDGWWSGANPSRITVPSGVNKVRVSWNLPFTLDSSRTAVGAELFVNGVSTNPRMTWVAKHVNTGIVNNELVGTTSMLEVTPGDYFQIENYYSGMTGDMAATNNAWISVEDLTDNYAGCVIKQDSGTVSGNWTTGRLIAFNTEVYDPLEMFDFGVSNTRITIPSGVTKARAMFMFNPSYSNQINAKTCEIRLNGTVVAQNILAAAGAGLGTQQFESDACVVSRIVDVSPSDYFEAWASIGDSSLIKPRAYQASNWFEVQVWA